MYFKKPHIKRLPLSVTPTEKFPAAILTNFKWFVLVRVGMFVFLVYPIPSYPIELSPQEYISPYFVKNNE